MSHPRRGPRSRRDSALASPQLQLVAHTCIFGDDEERLLDLLTPKVASTTDTTLAAVPDEPALSMIFTAAREHRRVAQEILDRSVPVNTKRSYATHIRAWARWCRDRGIPALPADPSQVVNFLTAYAVEFTDGVARRGEHGELIQAKAVSSLTVRASALYKIHHHAGLPSPTEDPAVQELLSGLRKMFHVRPRNAKGAIDQGMLRQIVAAVRPQAGHLRRWAVILLNARTKASVAAIRQLHWADIDLDRRLLTLTRLNGSAATIALEAHPDPRLDLAHVLAELRAAAFDLGTVFVNDLGQPQTRQSLHAILENARCAIGPLTGARPVRLLALHADIVQAGDAKSIRDVALLTAGWWAALRRSELSALSWRDLTRRPDGHWALLIRHSKTDQEGRGVTLYLPRVATSDGQTSCPSRAMDAWHAHVTRVLGTDPMRHPDKLPVFSAVDRFGRLPQRPGKLHRLSGHAINELIQSVVAAAGIDPESDGRPLYGGHSLRAGFVTEALRDNKMTVEQVKEVTRHESLDVLLRYRREIQGFATSPVHQLVTALQLGDDA